MYIFPAIDLIDKKVVRLVKGDYDKKTVYNDNPLEVAKGFYNIGAEFLHVVDLDGAKSGHTENFEIVKELAENSGLKLEIGGGIRNEETVKKYIDSGVYRVILGTSAVKDPDFLEAMVNKYKEKIAVGVDISDGYVAINGWLEKSNLECFDFFDKLCKIGVKTVICTDISKDGAMMGTNHELYKELVSKYDIDITASGGVSSIDDVKKLNDINIYGAIIGKALYNGAVSLKEAVAVTKGEQL